MPPLTLPDQTTAPMTKGQALALHRLATNRNCSPAT